MHEYKIKIIIGDPKGRRSESELTIGDYVMGRHENADIQFPATASTVSRNHAKLKVRPGVVEVEDLESRSGVMLNGKFIREGEVKPKSIIRIGDYEMTVVFPEEDKVHKEVKKIINLDQEQTVQEITESFSQDLQKLQEVTQSLVEMTGRRIIGREEEIRMVWATLLSKGHTLMIGVPGLAKTFLVTTLAEVLGLSFKRIQFTPDLMPSDIIGSNVIQEGEDGKRIFEFIQGPIFTQLLLADEINRTPPKTQAALLEAMQERQVTVGNRSLRLPTPFCVIASQNPIEQEGTYPLPEAQQDRFATCIVLDYPHRNDEIDILIETTQGTTEKIEKIVESMDLLRFQSVVDKISIPRELATYTADLVRATRPNQEHALSWVEDWVDWGAGPRAGQAIIRTAKALAAMDGRPTIGISDIQKVAVPVLRHRIACNYRAKADDMNEDKIIERLIKDLPRP